jgi:hypothetical protein
MTKILGAEIFEDNLSFTGGTINWYSHNDPLGNPEIVADATKGHTDTHCLEIKNSSYISSGAVFANYTAKGLTSGCVPGRDITCSVWIYDAAISADWDSETTYNQFDTVYYAGKEYSSLINTNLNNTPDLATTKWQQVGFYMNMQCYSDSAGVDNVGGRSSTIINVTTAGVWQNVTFTYKLPTTAYYTKINFYNSNTSRSIFMDDASLKMDNTLQVHTLIVSPQYQATFTPSMSKILTVGHEVWGTTTTPANTLAAKLSILNQSISPIYTNIITTDTSSNIPFQTTSIDVSSLATGVYYTAQVDIVLQSDHSTILYTDTHLFTILNHEFSNYQTFINADGVLIYNNVPFLPIGMYTAKLTSTGSMFDSTIITKLQAAKINTSICINQFQGAETVDQPELHYFADSIQQLLDAGIYTLFDMASINSGTSYAQYYTDPADSSNWIDAIEWLVNKVKDCAGVIGWYINDEREGYTYGTELKTIYDKIKELDLLNRPVWQVNHSMQDLTELFTSSDCYGLDNYILQGNYKQSLFGRQTKRIFNDGLGRGLVYMVAECTNQSGGTPTEAQMLGQAYQAFINGARSIFWYSSFDITTDAQWTALTNTNTHILSIQDILLATNASEQVICNDANINSITRKINDRYHILAVNTSTNSISPTFYIPAGITSGASIDVGIPGAETSKLTITDTAFSDTIAAGATRIYSFTATDSSIISDSSTNNTVGMLGSVITGIKRPNKDYLFSEVFNSKTTLLECILSCGEYLNNYSVGYEFGYTQSDSVTWADYTKLKNHEKFIIPERKLERTTTLDHLTFKSEWGRWSSGCVIEVYEVINDINTLVPTTEYQYNRLAGSVTFSVAKLNDIKISLTFPNIYRFGVKILTYDNNIFPLYKFGVNFTIKQL